MESEEAACPLERPLPPGRKAMLYLTVGLSIAFCVFFFIAAWIALFG